MKKFKSALFVVLIIIMVGLKVSYANSIEITNEAIQNTITKIYEEDNIVNLNYIAITPGLELINFGINGNYYNFTYNTENKPTFQYKASLKKGISYEEFEKEVNFEEVFLIAYMAIANIQGVDFAEARDYYLSSFQNNPSVPTSEYNIVNDNENVSTNENSKIIYKSEFGNRIKEYIHSLYGSQSKVVDDMYIITINMEEKEETIPNINYYNCDIIYTMEINSEAIYEKLQDKEESQLHSDNNITGNNQEENDQELNTNNNGVSTKSMQSGYSMIIIGIILTILGIVTIIVMKVKYNK